MLGPNCGIAKNIKRCTYCYAKLIVWVGGNVLAPNRRNSVPCTVRTSSQRSCKGSYLSSIVLSLKIHPWLSLFISSSEYNSLCLIINWTLDLICLWALMFFFFFYNERSNSLLNNLIVQILCFQSWEFMLFYFFVWNVCLCFHFTFLSVKQNQSWILVTLIWFNFNNFLKFAILPWNMFRY